MMSAVKRLLFLALVMTSTATQAATSFDVALPAMAIRDAPFTFTVTARDGSAVDASYLGTVHFTSSDPGATLPADYTFTSGDSGTHQFSATMPHPDPPFEQRVTRVRIDEAVGVERPDVGLRDGAVVPEDQFEMRVGSDRRRRIRRDRADIHAFVHRLEQPCERGGALFQSV